MSKRGLILSYVAICCLLSISFASANFACGSVVKSDNSSTVSPSWLNVKVYYSEKPAVYTTCQVSPENNKFCCSPRDITNVTWAVGKVVNAEISDSDYFTATVNKSISGAGYDIFPDLVLEKFVQIIEPNSSVYLNISTLQVILQSASKYNNIKYTLMKENSTIEQINVCNSCNSAEINLTNLTSGQYSLKATSYLGSDEHSQTVNFTVLSHITVTRTISCDGCKANKVPSDAQRVDVSLTLQASDPIKGTFKDFFPADWIYQGNMQVDEATESHNSLSWNIDGKTATVHYTLLPPRNLFNSKYTFQSQLGDYPLSADVISLNRFSFLDFAGLKKVYIKSVIPANLVTTLRASAQTPIVIYPTGVAATEVAIFPKDSDSNVLSLVKKTANLDLDNSKSTFMIWTSMNESNIDKVFMKLSIAKKSIKKNQNVSLYHYDSISSSWGQIPIEFVSENATVRNYQSFNDKVGGYAVVIA